ncbi:hypothetical protein [Parapedobacter soli]|nr:hypothetical protein [Parapedobacter soli]
MSKTKPNPRIWKAIKEAKRKNPDAPQKESSGDREFDKAVAKLLKPKK